LLRFRTSKHASSGTPRAYRTVPIAPSQSSAPSAIRSLNACGIPAPQRGQHPRDDLIDAQAGGVHREMCARVVRLTRAVQRLDLRGGRLEHWAAADAPGALEQIWQVAVQPDDGAKSAKRIHPVVTTRQAAAGGDDVRRLQGELCQHFTLQTAEDVLAGLA